ncbi:HPF/RaiA family ribosome-associated protein [Noviherbaspirillum sp. 17J57-3]|uniref:HPF/RaiA family ribosome-associated protein n=2 Tax=Noviherbaspirillum galbum TaxID=2709383 RepID=A0A6B3SJM5_9BURK|nr:HPF/RaiA family ribosome-associated protein [Noviherbaspirillum galbum]
MVAKEFSLSPSLQEHVLRRLRSAFARTQHRVGRIIVRLRDLNGPRGGRDKACQISVELPGQPEVVIREVQENMYGAIDNAVKRAAYRAMRMVDRKSRLARRGRDDRQLRIDDDEKDAGQP